MKTVRFLFLTIIVALLAACRGGQTSSVQVVGDTVAFKYATQLTVVRYDGYTVVTLKNPWKEGVTLHQYVLVPAGSAVANSPLSTLHSSLPNATVIRTPLSRSMIFSPVHCAMLLDFGKQDCIAGVADLKYIKIPWIQQQVKQGRISDVGDGLSPVIEKIIDQRPDALFLSPFENSGGYGKLEEIDIPIVECAEYMETTPLGRAEWLRFYGILFGCEEKADSLFDAIDKNYNDLKTLVTQKNRPSVLLDKVTGVNAHTVAMIPIAVFAATGVITAKDLQGVNWSVLWMVAGGFALGVALNESGLAENAIQSIPFDKWSPLVILIIAMLVCYAMSNFISNTATTALLVPVLAVVCKGMGDRLDSIGGVTTMLIAIAVAASVSMCLPNSTPPNAIAHSTGLVKQNEMLKVGIVIGIVGMVLGYFTLRLM